MEFGDQGRVVEEEKSKNTEVGHQNASYSRPTASQVDVSNLPEERNIEEERGREGAISRRRVSTESNARSHESQEHAKSRSNSRDLLGSPRGMKIDTQPRLTFPNSNRQDISTINRGPEGNFYNLRNWNNIRKSNERGRESATSLLSIEDNALATRVKNTSEADQSPETRQEDISSISSLLVNHL